MLCLSMSEPPIAHGYFVGLSACLTASKYVNEEPYEVSKDVHGMIGGPRHARGMAFAKV